jgi:hypothetical protein
MGAVIDTPPYPLAGGYARRCSNSEVTWRLLGDGVKTRHGTVRTTRWRSLWKRQKSATRIIGRSDQLKLLRTTHHATRAEF